VPRHTHLSFLSVYNLIAEELLMSVEKQGENLADPFGGLGLTEPQKLRIRLLTGIAVIAIASWIGWNQYNKSFSTAERDNSNHWTIIVHKRSGWFDAGIALPSNGNNLIFRSDTRTLVSVDGREYSIPAGQGELTLNDVPQTADIEFKLSVDAHQPVGRVSLNIF
jgi:hypothetical protein